MPQSTILTSTDPYQHQKSIRAAAVNIFISSPGEYRAEVARIDLHKLWMQRCRETLPRIAHAANIPSRNAIFFLTDAEQASMHHTGMELKSGEIMFYAPAAEHYHRSSMECRWGGMSLTPDDLAQAGRAVVGYELTAPPTTRKFTPLSHAMTRLLRLNRAAGDLAAADPAVLNHPEVARAVEQALVRAMVECLTDDNAGSGDYRSYERIPVMRRLERVLEANPDGPLYLPEICAAIGVSVRTLHMHCHEHLGMSPRRYLWLRRMNLARRALMHADLRKTVTTIANDHGFAELGRFAISYRRLFGESPSVSLRRPPDHALQPAQAARLPILP